MPLPSTHRLAVLALAIFGTAAANASAQSLKPLTLRTEWRVDGDAKDLNKIGEVSVGPNGTVAAVLPQDQSVRLFSSLGRALGTIGPNGLAMPEFQSVFRMGWKGDTLWAFDVQLRRVSMIRQAGSVTRHISLNYDPKVPPSSTGQVMVGAVPVKFLASDSMIASGYSGDRSMKHFTPSLFRTNLSQTRFSEIATLPAPNCGAVRASTRADCRIGLSAFSPNGEWVAIADLPTTSTGLGGFDLRLISSGGRRVFSRRIRAPSLKSRWSALPAFLFVGSDGVIWVGGASDNGVMWMAFDQGGEAIGSTVVPANYRMAVVSQKRIWVIETDAKGVESILQLGVGAAK